MPRCAPPGVGFGAGARSARQRRAPDVARRVPRCHDALHGVGDPAHSIGSAAVSRQRPRPLSRRHARSPGLGRLRAVGPDSARLHVHGRGRRCPIRSPAVWRRASPSRACWPQRAPGPDPHRAWHLSPFAITGTDLLHVRRRADPDRARLCVSVPPRLDQRADATRGRRADPRRLLGGLRTLSAAAAGIRYARRSASAPTGRTTSPASRRTGTRTRTWPPAPTNGS